MMMVEAWNWNQSYTSSTSTTFFINNLSLKLKIQFQIFNAVLTVLFPKFFTRQLRYADFPDSAVETKKGIALIIHEESACEDKVDITCHISGHRWIKVGFTPFQMEQRIQWIVGYAMADWIVGILVVLIASVGDICNKISKKKKMKIINIICRDFQLMERFFVLNCHLFIHLSIHLSFVNQRF